MIVCNQVSVGTSATKLIDNVTEVSTVVITNAAATATTIVYIGTSASVTTSNGHPIPAGGSVTLRNVTGGPIYAISAAASTPVGYVVGNQYG